MRRLIGGIALVLAAAGCRAAGAPATPKAGPDAIEIHGSPTPFTEVSAGPVSALIPDRWHPVITGIGADEGFYASPRPDAWQRMDGSVAGISATWVDATQVGVPSDFYYLVATGPALGQLTDSADCRALSEHVIVDHRPSFFTGEAGSAGDYVARGEGTCEIGGSLTRWAYFVASPGFGPVRKVGIPTSGLYVVVAVLPDNRKAHGMLRTLLDGTRFGNANLSDFVSAARAA